MVSVCASGTRLISLLRLSGQSARVGRDIVITSLHSGEKLHEESAAADEKAALGEVMTLRQRLEALRSRPQP